MKRFRPKISIRRLMIAVAIISLILGLRVRSARYDRRAQAYFLITFHHGSFIRLDGRFVASDPAVRIRDEWASRMAVKYWRLSDYPWLPVAPEPPPPVEAHSHLTPTGDPPIGRVMEDWPFARQRPPLWTFLWTWR